MISTAVAHLEYTQLREREQHAVIYRNEVFCKLTDWKREILSIEQNVLT